jgi:hypothetical protein
VPSLNHEGPIELIRQRPQLAVEILGLVSDVPLPDKTAVALGSTDASQAVPQEHKADIVVVISDKATGAPALAVIVEPQGRDEPTKKYSWPIYVTNLRRANQCPEAVLIVVCWNEAEARKCRAPIPTGHPGFVLAPIVIGPRSTPGLADASPWLTILGGTIAAIDLETESGRRLVLEAISATGVGTADTRSLATIILGVASDAARMELEAMMRTTPYRSEFFDAAIEQGKAEGKAEDVIKVLNARGITITGDQREQVASCTDLGQLDLWFDRALSAATAADVFKA